MQSIVYASNRWKYLSYSQSIIKYLCIFTFLWIKFSVYVSFCVCGSKPCIWCVGVWFQSLQTFLLSVFLIWGFMWGIMIRCIYFSFYCDLHLFAYNSDLEVSLHTSLILIYIWKYLNILVLLQFTSGRIYVYLFNHFSASRYIRCMPFHLINIFNLICI